MRYTLAIAALAIAVAFWAYSPNTLQPLQRVSAPSVGVERTFSPQSELFANAVRHANAPSEEAVVSSGQDRPSWHPVVTVIQPTDGPRSQLTSVKPADPSARFELVRKLQRELKRVGCFDEKVDGRWSSSTKQSLRLFTQRVNATLPLNEPDYILLSLLQGQTSKICGEACRSGEFPDQNGRCVAGPVIARTTAPYGVTSSSSVDAKTGSEFAASKPATSDIAAASSIPPYAGRMSIGAPLPDATAQSPSPSPVAANAETRPALPGVRPVDDLFVHPLGTP